MSANDGPNPATTTRFSLIPALSKLYRSKSASREAFTIGKEEEAIKDQPEKGFFSRLFSSKKGAAVQSEAPPLQRKPSLWQRSKSFLKPKSVKVEVSGEDSVSTIDLPRVRKTQLPKLKIKGSGAALRVDFSGFVLGKPAVTVDTDALLQKMFELNEQSYRELRAKYVVSDEGEATYLSPVMTAVTLSEMEKPRPNELNEPSAADLLAVETLHMEANQQPYHHLEHNNDAFNDDPQLDSPLLSVSGTFVEDDMNLSIADSMSSSPNEDSTENTSAFNGQIFEAGYFDNSSSIEAQSVDSPPSDWSITRLNEEFDVLNVKAPIRHLDGSIHFHFDGSAESVVFEDWRREKEESQQETQQEAQESQQNTQELSSFEQNQSFQSLYSVPRAAASTQPSFRARSVSNSLLTGNEQRKTLGARIAQIVAIFERGLQEELNSNV